MLFAFISLRIDVLFFNALLGGSPVVRPEGVQHLLYSPQILWFFLIELFIYSSFLLFDSFSATQSFSHWLLNPWWITVSWLLSIKLEFFRKLSVCLISFPSILLGNIALSKPDLNLKFLFLGAFICFNNSWFLIIPYCSLKNSQY